MISKRKLLANALNFSGILYFKGLLRRKQTSDITIITYHRIIDPEKIGSANREVVSATPKEFEKQMSFVKKNFTPINFFDLKNILEGSLPIPENPIIITFDDGYRDNYDFAFPVLKKLGLKSVVFLATGFIGTQKMFWWDRVSCNVLRTKKSALSLPSLYNIQIDLPESRYAFIEELLNKIKTMPDSKKNCIIDELEECCELDSSAYNSTMMDWDMALEMQNGGVELGAHTVNHPVLSRIESDILLEQEIKLSADTIAMKTGVRPVSFCYPVGKESSFNDNVVKTVEKQGFSFAVTLVHGVNRLPNIDAFCMNRLNVNYMDSFEEYKAKLLLPDIIRY